MLPLTSFISFPDPDMGEIRDPRKETYYEGELIFPCFLYKNDINEMLSFLAFQAQPRGAG